MSDAPVNPPAARPAPPIRVVRYGAMRYVGEFAHRPELALNCCTKVVVQTERGIELGECVGSCGKPLTREQIDSYVENSGPEFCRPNAGRVLRVASPQDVSEQEHLNAHLKDDVHTCAELAAQLRLEMKVVTAEHLLGGERIVFYFRSPGRVDFRQLVKDLARHYRTRIEMRQVGARDEARLIADYEVCGREVCCKSFLKQLRPVTMRMAKLQKSTLDPSKVSGRCGRLRCCLRYEQPGYEEWARSLPRVGARVNTAYGPGTIIDRQLLTQLLMVRLEDGRQFAIPLEELEGHAFPEGPAAPRTSEHERPPPPRGQFVEAPFMDRPTGPDPEPPAPLTEPPPQAPPAAGADKPTAPQRREHGRRRHRRRRGGRGGGPRGAGESGSAPQP